MAELVLKEEVYAVIGAAIDVYHQLGRGFLEPLYYSLGNESDSAQQGKVGKCR